MKNTIAQLQLLVAKIDRRHIQFAYLALALAGAIMRSPVDGGGGPY
jgi:hypothetical protein